MAAARSALAVALAVGGVALGCAPNARQLSWEIVFVDAALAARAARVEGRILEGGCGSAIVLYAADAAAGETPAMPPRLPAGRYGFEGRARDASCIEFATGCLDVVLPRDDGSTVSVAVAATVERPICDAAMCVAARCGSGDAGGLDAGTDGGTTDGGGTDAGGTDGGGSDARLDGASPDAPGGDAGCTLDGGCGPRRLVRELSLGNAFACAIVDDGALLCWGDNLSGQLGQGASGGAPLDRPTRVGTSTAWSVLGAGDAHVCASEGAMLSCWGDNEDGQIGFADLVSRSVPSPVTSATGPWSRIEGAHVGDGTCTLSPSGVIACMGQNDYGQLGLADNIDHAALAAWSGTWRSLAVGHHFTCGVATDGTLSCTGRNAVGQLGLGTSGVGTNTNVPTRLGAETTWTEVAAGDQFACALRGTGELWCWGLGADGQLGRGDLLSSLIPARVGTAATWSELALGRAHACGLRAGALYCWGANDIGQLGLGTSGADVTSEARVGTASDWTAIYAGGDFTCGTRTGGELYCWGDNTMGQLGVGDLAVHPSPTRVTL